MSNYPLMDDPDNLHAASGKSAAQITLDNLDRLSADDLRISASTLKAQAQIAAKAGYTQLAANLSRAAELTAVPNDELLKMYDLLRPGRASYDTLTALAERLETVYNAPINGQFIREAADAYRRRGLLRRES
jgi:propanediol dehydratase small subunit